MNKSKPVVTSAPAKNKINGQDVFTFSVSNGYLDITFTNFGCTLISIFAPDKNGDKKNVVSGFDSPEAYLDPHPYFGSIVGRFANRIEFGKFVLNGIPYQLPINREPNHLHGGINGFNKKVWSVKEVISNEEAAGVVFTYTSTDKEEGYPGTMEVTVTYLLNSNSELILKYEATSDQPTIVNLTNHSYFNLSGFIGATIYEHQLKVNAAYYTKKNDNNVPSGEISAVENTPLDFRESKPVGENINEMMKDNGYDHNFVLDNKTGAVALAATLYEPVSGRLLQVLTDQPGIQVYTANLWDDSITGSHGISYSKHAAIALETQNFPDAPNHTNFPSAVLLPGETYATTTIYHFSTQ